MLAPLSKTYQKTKSSKKKSGLIEMTYCSGLFPDGPERIDLPVQKRIGSGTPAVTSVKQCPCDKLP